MKTAMHRTVMVIAFVLVVLWSLIARLFDGLRMAPFYAWCDIREDAASFARMWRAGRID